MSMADDFNAMRAARQQRHQEWKASNTATIAASGIRFVSRNDGESLLFRETGKPRVDFFPSTGRWKVAGLKKTYSGGADRFLSWYSTQQSEVQS